MSANEKTTDTTVIQNRSARKRSAPRTRIDLSVPIHELPQLLTIPETAAVMRCSTRTVASRIARGLLKTTCPCAGNRLVLRSSVELAIEQGGDL